MHGACRTLNEESCFENSVPRSIRFKLCIEPSSGGGHRHRLRCDFAAFRRLIATGLHAMPLRYKKHPKLTNGKIRKPFVLGAIIDLGLCCNLHDQDTLDELRASYSLMKQSLDKLGLPVPKNSGGTDRLLRYLDCAVINALHVYRKKSRLPPYQTVRATFHEGGALYEVRNSAGSRMSRLPCGMNDKFSAISDHIRYGDPATAGPGRRLTQ